MERDGRGLHPSVSLVCLIAALFGSFVPPRRLWYRPDSGHHSDSDPVPLRHAPSVGGACTEEDLEGTRARPLLRSDVGANTGCKRICGSWRRTDLHLVQPSAPRPSPHEYSPDPAPLTCSGSSGSGRICSGFSRRQEASTWPQRLARFFTTRQPPPHGIPTGGPRRTLLRLVISLPCEAGPWLLKTS